MGRKLTLSRFLSVFVAAFVLSACEFSVLDFGSKNAGPPPFTVDISSGSNGVSPILITGGTPPYTARVIEGAEGLNNKIKVLRRMGYGYTNPVSYCRKILQRCGYLNHVSINTDEFFYKVPAPR